MANPLHIKTDTSRQIPVDKFAARIRWVQYRTRLFPGQMSFHPTDELAAREAWWLTLRSDPAWLKRRIRRGLGVKALGV